MNSTIPKMLSAHSSIRPIKTWSARPPLPRDFRNWRIGEGAALRRRGSAAANKVRHRRCHQRCRGADELVLAQSSCAVGSSLLLIPVPDRQLRIAALG